jgi:hypothetical protein
MAAAAKRSGTSVLAACKEMFFLRERVRTDVLSIALSKLKI